MNLRSIALATAVFGASCGDDAMPPSDAGGLPVVEPRGPRCDELDVAAGKACLEEGWFHFSRWTTAVFHNPSLAARTADLPLRPVYLDTFLIDRHEVTNAEYAAYVASTGTPPPPDVCGYADHAYEEPSWFELRPEVSGWVGGVPSPERSEHPVVCITRAEAQAFCEARGGRLPSVFEWSRSVRAPYPDARRFPWGNTPPPEASEPWPGLQSGWEREYAWVGEYGTRFALDTAAVGTATRGASPDGVMDLSGNVSELLAACEEDLAEIPETAEPLIRPASGAPADTCRDGVVVAGSNWRSFNEPELVFPATIFTMHGEASSTSIRYPGIGGNGWDVYAGVEPNLWGEPTPLSPVTDPAGNDRRSWRIGFRCVYDAIVR